METRVEVALLIKEINLVAMKRDIKFDVTDYLDEQIHIEKASKKPGYEQRVG